MGWEVLSGEWWRGAQLRAHIVQIGHPYCGVVTEVIGDMLIDIARYCDGTVPKLGRNEFCWQAGAEGIGGPTVSRSVDPHVGECRPFDKLHAQ